LRTGRRIHEGEDAVDLVRKMAQLPAPQIRSIAPDASAPYARVIDRALEFNRDDRYASAAAMREDVERAIAELDAAASRPAPRKPSLPPPRRLAPTEPRARRTEPAADPRERDAVQPLTYATDESIRIPKTGSVWPWLALLLIGGLGVALWRDDAHRTLLFDAVKAWGSRLHAPATPSASGEAPAAAPGVSNPVTVDGGAASAASSEAGHPPAPPGSGTPPHRPKPAKVAPSKTRSPARSH
jgi:hypothetical protein